MTDMEAETLLSGLSRTTGRTRIVERDRKATARGAAALRLKGMLVEALEAAEWGSHDGSMPCCPDCKRLRGVAETANPHAPTCALARALAEARKEPA